MKLRILIQYAVLSIPFCILLSCASLSGEERANLAEIITFSMDTISRNVKINSRIAVLEIQEITGNDGQTETERSRYLLDLLTKRLVDIRKFIVLDKTSLQVRKGGQSFQSPGEISDDRAISAGRVIGADVVVTGVITRNGGISYLRLKALDVRTGQILCMIYKSIPAAKR
jgi:curli biogenesis system outer membrane secretion channel CsgG